jgi:hypothetical protein
MLDEFRSAIEGKQISRRAPGSTGALRPSPPKKALPPLSTDHAQRGEMVLKASSLCKKLGRARLLFRLSWQEYSRHKVARWNCQAMERGMAGKTVVVRLNQQQIELIDRTIAKGEAPDRAGLVKRALREQAAKVQAPKGAAR